MDPQNEHPDIEGQANDSQDDGNNGGGHPAWQEILDVVPDSLHPLLRPKLEQWDKGVQERFQNIHQQYDPYKPLLEQKVDPTLIQQGLGLVERFSDDPEAVIQQAIQAFGLDYVKKAELEALQQVSSNDDDNDDYFGGDDITKHPQFKQMQQALESMQGKLTAREQAELEAQQAEQFEQVLTDLESEHGKFDQYYVTALMSQGVDGATAVKQYQDTINQAAAQLAAQSNQQQRTQPPVVMGADGTSGSGIPSQPIKMGDMKNSEVNQLVLEMLKASESKE